MNILDAKSYPEFDAREFLDALCDPALVVETSGAIRLVNKAALEVSPSVVPGIDLCHMAGPAEKDVQQFLRRSSGSTAPFIGAIYLPDPAGVARKYRSRARLLRSTRAGLVFIQCMEVNEDKFTLLNSRIEALNAEIRLHLHTKAVLQESLQERNILIREIHHRVKNNIQILQGMLSVSEIETQNVEVKRILADAKRRLAAMASVQQTMYQTDHQNYQADEFLKALISQLKETWPPETRIEVAVDGNGKLGNDVAAPLALIVNELVTNAVKYGSRGAGCVVRILLQATPEQIALSVSDSGPGFEPGSTDRKSSGLGLVRGLARQLGGKFSVESSNGARCTLIFPNRAHEQASTLSQREIAGRIQ